MRMNYCDGKGNILTEIEVDYKQQTVNIVNHTDNILYRAFGINDSLGFALVRRGELEGRMYEIHTTYIPFEEFHRLIGNDIFSYMKYGGTLRQAHL